LLMGERGRGWGGAISYDCEKAWSSIINVLAVLPKRNRKEVYIVPTGPMYRVAAINPEF
jgi:hypothetical protein